MNQLQGEQQSAFANNQAALSAVSSAWAPVLAGGSIPYGYSPGLDSLLKSNIVNQGATATTNAENASQLQQLQKSGGAPGAAAPGSQAAINAEIEAKGQQSTAQNLSNEKIAGYEQGETNLKDATSAELGVAGGQNDVGLAGASTQSGDLAASAAEAAWQENQTSSPAAIIGDIGAAAGDVGKIAGAVSGIGDIGSMFSSPSYANASDDPHLQP